MPFSNWEWQSDFRIKGREQVPNDGAGTRSVTPSYFTTMGIPLQRGRAFSADDSSSSPSVAIVSDAFVREHMAGLDPIGASDFDHLIRKLQQTLGLTVYMVTHDLDTIFTVCDRVAVLADKKIVRTGSPTELQRQPNHPWIKEYFCGERARAATPGERPRIPA